LQSYVASFVASLSQVSPPLSAESVFQAIRSTLGYEHPLVQHAFKIALKVIEPIEKPARQVKVRLAKVK
jgi:hypothetical protein